MPYITRHVASYKRHAAMLARLCELNTDAPTGTHYEYRVNQDAPSRPHQIYRVTEIAEENMPTTTRTPRPIRHTLSATRTHFTSYVSGHEWRYQAQRKADAMNASAVIGTVYHVEFNSQTPEKPYRVIRYVQIFVRGISQESCVIVASGESAHSVVRQTWALQHATGSWEYRAAELNTFIPDRTGYVIYRSLQTEGTLAVPTMPLWADLPPDDEGTQLRVTDTMRATAWSMPSISEVVAEALRRSQEEAARVRRTTCPRCRNSVQSDRVSTVNTWRGGELMCDSCERQHNTCVSCDGRIHRYDTCTSPEDTYFCPNCFRDTYTYCDYCQSNYNHNEYDECGCDESREARGCTCADCREERDSDGDRYAGDIRNYSYRPNPVFRGEGPLYFGMEIEVTANRYALSDRAADVKNAFGDLVYLKEDGSISSGFEIVTHPMSYQWAMEELPWEKWRFLQHQGIGADDSTGIHIHVSRAGFAGPAHTYRWLQFFYRSQEQVQKIARRSNPSYARFNVDQRAKHVMAAKGNKGRCGNCYDCRNGYFYCSEGNRFERYSAINCQNENTFEVRVFASTVDATQIKAALGLVSASVEYTRGITSNQIIRDDAWSWSSFSAWVAQRPEYTALTEEINRLCVC